MKEMFQIPAFRGARSRLCRSLVVLLQSECPSEDAGIAKLCPYDGGAQWAAVNGVAQSRTRLKRLSSSNSSSSNLLIANNLKN